YRYYITQEQFESVPEDERGNILMRAVLLDEEQIARYSDILSPLPDTSLADRGYDDYVQDCSDRRAAGVTEFTATRTGFTAVTDYDSDQLVFFSVPYDDGFTATVNGQAARIEKVDNGLMAVRVPAGHAEIVFTYRTPGLDVGLAVTLT